MKKLIACVIFIFACPAMASITCTTTVTGTTYCTGTDNSGRAVDTQSHTTGTGATMKTGSENGRQISRECYTTNTGTTYCE